MDEPEVAQPGGCEGTRLAAKLGNAALVPHTSLGPEPWLPVLFLCTLVVRHPKFHRECLHRISVPRILTPMLAVSLVVPEHYPGCHRASPGCSLWWNRRASRAGLSFALEAMCSVLPSSVLV